MKVKTAIIAAISLATTASSQAFTIDFNDATLSNAASKVGQTIGSITVAVVGYGDVVFTSSDNLLIGDRYDNSIDKNTIEMTSNGDSVHVSFPRDVIILTAGDLGQGEGESLQVSGVLPGKEHDITAILDSGTDGLGLKSITFQEVPEPSSAVLGVIGMSMILLRRRK